MEPISETNFRCTKCKKDKPESAYYFNGKYRRSKCRDCISIEGKEYRKRKRVPIALVQHALKEIIVRTGSERKAAIELGVSRTLLRTWIRKNAPVHGNRRLLAKNVEKESVKLILITLQRLRRDNVLYDHVGKPGPKPYWFTTDNKEAERRGRNRRKTE